MKKLSYLIVLTLILGLVLTGCSLLSNVGQVPTTEQSGITYLTKNPSSDLVGLWHFDEETGETTVVDSSEYGNNGTVYGATTGVSGKFGDALSFDGSYDYVEVPDSSILEPSTITVEAWVKNSGTPGTFKYIISKVYDAKLGSYSSYAFYTGGSGGLRFYVGSASTSWVGSPVADASLWDGNWHYIAGTYDGSKVRLFVDGNQVGTGTSATLTIAYNGGNLYIGYYGPYDYPTYFPGTIDEVRIWNRALEDIEIAYNYSLRDIGIDIKPGSDPNSINLGSKGVVPVAILGSDTFYANTVDPFTVKLAGASVRFKGNSGNAGSLEDVNGDGYLDLVVQVYTNELDEPGDGEIFLTAYTYDGPAITGSDSVRIVPPE